MTFKEYLSKVEGLTPDQIDAIISGMSAQKLYISANERIDERFEAQRVKLETAEALVTELKASNEGNADLQSKVAKYEADITDLQSKYDKDIARFNALDYLRQQGAVDPEYALFKLGELEVKEGKFVDFENKVKSFQESAPTQFTNEDGDKNPGGYKVIDSKLDGKQGGGTKTFDLSTMTAEEINANWDAIQEENK